MWQSVCVQSALSLTDIGYDVLLPLGSTDSTFLSRVLVTYRYFRFNRPKSIHNPRLPEVSHSCSWNCSPDGPLMLCRSPHWQGIWKRPAKLQLQLLHLQINGRQDVIWCSITATWICLEMGYFGIPQVTQVMTFVFKWEASAWMCSWGRLRKFAGGCQSGVRWHGKTTIVTGWCMGVLDCHSCRNVILNQQFKYTDIVNQATSQRIWGRDVMRRSKTFWK